MLPNLIVHFLDFIRAWTGWWDEPKEGEMVSIPTSEPLSKQSFSPWHGSDPDGGIYENCVALSKYGRWSDWPCATKTCVACHIPTTPMFVMKGKIAKHFN